MFEFMSAMTLMASLQTAPDQIKIAQILDRYEKVAMEPKALLVYFQSKDRIDSSAGVGKFAIERTGSRSSWILTSHGDSKPDEKETLTMIDLRLYHLNPRSRAMMIWEENDASRRKFEERGAFIAFCIADPQQSKRDFKSRLIRENDDEYVVEFTPLKKPKFWFSLEPREAYEITFCRRDLKVIPAGAITYVRSKSGNSSDIEITKWSINDRSDTSVFPIVPPLLPSGWTSETIKYIEYPSVPKRNNE